MNKINRLFLLSINAVDSLSYMPSNTNKKREQKSKLLEEQLATCRLSSPELPLYQIKRSQILVLCIAG